MVAWESLGGLVLLLLNTLVFTEARFCLLLCLLLQELQWDLQLDHELRLLLDQNKDRLKFLVDTLEGVVLDLVLFFLGQLYVLSLFAVFFRGALLLSQSRLFLFDKLIVTLFFKLFRILVRRFLTFSGVFTRFPLIFLKEPEKWILKLPHLVLTSASIQAIF